MQTRLADNFAFTPRGDEAEAILRQCTHCGFCLPACPTYRLLGDERDSPRGRIYQIKQVLEGAPATPELGLHLDRCLTCRACESACPVDVPYHRLADLGREIVAEQAPPRLPSRLLRWGLRQVLPQRRLFAALLGLGRLARPLMTATLAAKVPAREARMVWPRTRNRRRRVLVMTGCVQPALAPGLDPYLATLLNDIGIDAEPLPGCCGAVDQHLGAPKAAQQRLRRLVDLCWPAVEGGAEAILVSASGCGAQLKEIGILLAEDPFYAEKANKVAARVKDPLELLEGECSRLRPALGVPRRLAFQSPCSLQHGQRLGGRVEALLSALGFELTPVVDANLCCGSAGTYSLLQPDMATQLRDNKLRHLLAGQPEWIVTANIGCQTHLASASPLPVRHWVELLAAAPANDRI